MDSGSALFNAMNRLAPRMTYLLATLSLTLIGATDFSTHEELMLAPFYAIPCFLVDWRIGRAPAMLYAIFASGVQWFIGTFGGHPYSQEIYFYWDILLNFFFYGALIWIIAKLRLALEMEQALSRMDFLTRLANYKAFVGTLDAQLQDTRRKPAALLMLAVQLDRFAAFNQEQGYTVGDLALAAVADVLRSTAGRQDLCARTDNSEFCSVAWSISEKEALARMRSLERQMDMLMLTRGWRLTYSIAAARFAAAPESAPAAMGKLRVLLNEARMAGKNRSLIRAWDTTGQMLGEHAAHAAPMMDFEKTGQMFIEPEAITTELDTATASAK